MGKPTREDAALLVQLAQLYDQTTMRIEGAPDILSAKFPTTYEAFVAAYPDENGPAWKVVQAMASFFETVGLLVRRELFNAELAEDWLLASAPWRALAPIIDHWRAEMGEPRLFEHFEWLAKRAGA